MTDMTTSRFARLTALLTGAAPVTAALAHPGHQHGSTLLERLQHALQTEWGPILLLGAVAVGGLLLLGKRRSD